jgi:hypothetical protein
MVANVIESSMGTNQSLKVPMMMNLHVSSAAPPRTQKLIGQTNPNPLLYVPENSAPIDDARRRGRRVLLRLNYPMYTLVTPDGVSAVVLNSPNAGLMPICTTRIYAEELRDRCAGTKDCVIHELPSRDELAAWIQNPPIKSGNKPAGFNILYYSIDPDGNSAGEINKDHFLAIIQEQLS